MKRIFEKCSHKKQLFLALSALVLCLSISIGVTMAYFTDWSSASGTGAVADLKPQTELKEELDGINKKIQVENTGETEVFVRVKVFYPDLNLQRKDGKVEIKGVSADGTDSDLWVYNEETGFWDYTKVLKSGEATDELQVNVTIKRVTNSRDFQIIVVHENSPAIYDQEGNAVPREWEAWNWPESQTEGEEGND